MSELSGIALPLTLPRRLIADLMHFSQKVPLVSIERPLHLASVATARQAARPRPGWCALFTKAYALVAARRPELRRAYVTCPWAHLYQHADNVASIAIERHWGDEIGVFFATLRGPEQIPLTEIAAFLRRCKEQPLDSISAFRRALLVSRFPRPLRRMAWWAGLNVFRAERARCFGTFGVTATARFGATPLCVQSPLTSTLHYGVVDPSGAVNARVAFDHRVLDGGAMARALCDLEEVFLREILAELKSLRSADAA
jgi:hypothetical protein